MNPYTARRLFNSPTQEERRVPGRMPQIKRTVPKPVVPRSWGIIANPYPISVSEEECILKRACLSVWFYYTSEGNLKRVRGGVYPQACMLVCMVLLLYGLHSQTTYLRGGPEQRDGGVLED